MEIKASHRAVAPSEERGTLMQRWPFPPIRFKDFNICFWVVFLFGFFGIFQREVALYNLDGYNKQSKTIFSLKFRDFFWRRTESSEGIQAPRIVPSKLNGMFQKAVAVHIDTCTLEIYIKPSGCI